MMSNASADVYSADEIALAAGVPDADVIAALEKLGHTRGADAFVSFADAVRLGRALLSANRTVPAGAPRPLFSMFASTGRSGRSTGVPLVVSSTLHITMLAVAVFIGTLSLTPNAATLRTDDRPEPSRLVFIATP